MKEQAREAGRFLSDAVLRSYAVVFFAPDRVTGALLLLATFVAPGHGLIGLCGVLITIAVALGLGFHKESIRNGHYVFNSLLTSLALAHLHAAHPLAPGALVLLLLASAVLTLLLSVSMMQAMQRLHMLPCLSLPFVAVSLPLFLLFYSFTGHPLPTVTPFQLVAEPAFLPAWARAFFQSFGAIFFVPHAVAGFLIAAAVARHSRLALLFAAAGYAGGVILLRQLGVDATTPEQSAYLGFNFVVAGLALGSVYFIPSRGSLLLGVFAALFCAIVALAAKAFLQPFGIPPLALPFNAVVLLALSALRHRDEADFIPANLFGFAKPEENLQAYHAGRVRFPDTQLPALYPPFYGERVVTQGVEGGITHAGPWRFALDFEVLDAHGGRFSGTGRRLEDYHTFNTPVLAPGDGVVTRLCTQVADNAPGGNNLDDNWGNYVVLGLEAGGFVCLSHFRQGSILVHLGQRVPRGALLGYGGNSGRSPLPHLHLNYQRTPEAGAASVPFRMVHFLRLAAGRREYIFSGLPAQDDSIKAAEFNPEIGAYFEKFEDTRWRYRVRDGGREHEETVTCTTASNGDFYFRSLTHRAVLTARVMDRVFCALDFQGDPRSVLYVFQLGLSRVPFTSEQDATWTDHLGLRPLLRPAVRWLMELTQPFLPYPLLRLTGRLEGVRDVAAWPLSLVVSAELDARTLRGPTLFRPQRVEVFLAKQQGIVGARMKHDGGELLIERLP